MVAVAGNGPEGIYARFYSYNDSSASYNFSISTRLTAKVRWTGKINWLNFY